MNNIRRKKLQEIDDRICVIQSDIEWIKDEEEEYKDNIPENLQGSERYEKAEDCVYRLDEAIEYLENVLDAIREAQD